MKAFQRGELLKFAAILKGQKVKYMYIWIKIERTQKCYYF